MDKFKTSSLTGNPIVFPIHVILLYKGECLGTKSTLGSMLRQLYMLQFIPQIKDMDAFVQ